MDFEEFEKEQEAKQKPTTSLVRHYGCGAAGSACGDITRPENLTPQQLKEWEVYMEYGYGGFYD